MIEEDQGFLVHHSIDMIWNMTTVVQSNSHSSNITSTYHIISTYSARKMSVPLCILVSNPAPPAGSTSSVRARLMSNGGSGYILRLSAITRRTSCILGISSNVGSLSPHTWSSQVKSGYLYLIFKREMILARCLCAMLVILCAMLVIL